ncbi:MAG TPA: ribosome maturation factor RimP [Acidimicrobiales bacterium]|nr:ribosome maturation factor RimP [Acidimicrobiales bacterium]
MGPADAVRALVEPVLAPDGIEVVDVEYAGGRLAVTIDRDGGIDLDTITSATRTVSRLLDEHDPIPGGRYLLEVSSPGLERVLRTPEHFARVVGQKVKLKTHAHVEGDRRLDGELEAADEHGVTVAGRRLDYGDIERANTVFEWGPAPKPTGPPKKSKSTTKAEAS